jgi:hypothetical protein
LTIVPVLVKITMEINLKKILKGYGRWKNSLRLALAARGLAEDSS